MKTCTQDALAGQDFVELGAHRRVTWPVIGIDELDRGRIGFAAGIAFKNRTWGRIRRIVLPIRRDEEQRQAPRSWAHLARKSAVKTKQDPPKIAGASMPTSRQYLTRRTAHGDRKGSASCLAAGCSIVDFHPLRYVSHRSQFPKYASCHPRVSGRSYRSLTFGSATRIAACISHEGRSVQQRSPG